MNVQQAPAHRRLLRRIQRHWEWGRAQGFGRLVEEDQLNPVERLHSGWRRAAWRRRHGVTPGQAVPVFLVGLQRSGTNMLVRGLETCPEFEVHNENDRAAFDRFRLRPDADIRALVERSRHRYVLFKPLCDSHRVDGLLDGLGTPRRGLAIWAYRHVDGRVRSALAKFGNNNLDVIRAIAAGRTRGMWQAERISPQTQALIESVDTATMSPETAAALFWYVRNVLFFEMGLDRRDDVLPASYESFLERPEASTRALCAFLGFEYDPGLHAHIEPRGGGGRRLDIDPVVRERCDELTARLDAAVEGTRRQVAV